MNNIQTKFNRLRKTLVDIHRSNGGDKLSTKPMYLTEFDIVRQSEILKEIDSLRNHLEQNDIKVAVISIFDLAIKILKDRNVLDEAVNAEKTMPKNRFLEALQIELDIQKLLIPELIQSMPEDAEFIFITGLDAASPFVNTHDVINAVDSQYSTKWIVFFYPGEYSGNKLNKFGIESEQSSNHYRAIKI